jgi:hypothetical protein
VPTDKVSLTAEICGARDLTTGYCRNIITPPCLHVHAAASVTEFPAASVLRDAMFFSRLVLDFIVLLVLTRALSTWLPTVDGKPLQFAEYPEILGRFNSS